MTIHKIVFDLDGTIANTSFSIIKSFNQAFRKRGFGEIDHHFFLKNASRGSLHLIKKNLRKKDFNIIKEINNDFYKFYKVNCDKQISAKRGLRWFLKKNEKKYTYIVCTNKNKNFSLKILKKLEINKYFSKVYGHDSFKYKKPSKKLFEFISKNNQKNYKTIIVGDSEIDYQFAKKSHSDFVLVKNGYTTKKMSKISKKYSINNFYEFDSIVRKIYE